MDDFVERLPERRAVERTAQAQRAGNVVEGPVGIQLVEKPESLLRERDRPLMLRARGSARRRLDLPPLPAGGLDARRQAFHGGRLEQVPKRQLHAELIPHAGDHLRGDERVPAEIEKAVQRPDPIETEQAGP